MFPKNDPSQMNRRERRIAEKLERERVAKLQMMPPARADGRPQYYDIPVNSQVECYYCLKQGLTGVKHRYKRAVTNDPANPPGNEPKGDVFFICTHHLPDNAVIYDPQSNMCRNKTGDHMWEEGKREDIREELRNVR